MEPCDGPEETGNTMSSTSDRRNKAKVIAVMTVAVILGAFGDVSLSRGMKMVGAVDHPTLLHAFRVRRHQPLCVERSWASDCVSIPVPGIAFVGGPEFRAAAFGRGLCAGDSPGVFSAWRGCQPPALAGQRAGGAGSGIGGKNVIGGTPMKMDVAPLFRETLFPKHEQEEP